MQQKPLDALKESRKQEGLDIWVLRTVKPTGRSFSPLFTSNQPKPEPEYEVFPVPPAKHGIFYAEDLYIVLKTNSDNQKIIHFWFGQAYNETPPPWIDNFEDLDLDWTASQHFEFQGLECSLFEDYFKRIQPAIRYKRGRHPEPYAERVRGDTRFYKVECLDKTQYRVNEIPFNISLMTKEQCFVLDTDFNTRTYLSDRIDVKERNKSIIVANRIREQDHEGNGPVEVVDLTTFSNDVGREDYVKEAKLLEEQEELPPDVDYDVPDDDPQSPQVQLNMITLIGSDDLDTCYPPRFKYIRRPKKTANTDNDRGFFCRTTKRMSTGIRRMLGLEIKNEMEFEIPSLDDKFYRQLVTKSLKQDNLNSRKCYVLQGTEGQGVFIWIGKSCNKACKQELTEVMRLENKRCQQNDEIYDNEVDLTDSDVYTKKKDDKKDKEDRKIPQWTHIVKITEGNETVKFKKYFSNWE